jgi:3'-phosphoadenosine 5'-phosphosulfate (PAPS) 3'-phosphatase
MNNKLSVDVYHKGPNDKFTNIDWMVQKMMENHLDKYFPSLKIIGEEDTTKHLEVDNLYLEVDESINFDKISLDNIDSEFNYLDSNDLCMFVDPIDSTSSFIKKNYDPVTTLIGITYKSLPLLGFIHFPEKNGDSITYFNCPKKGLYSYNVEKDEIQKIEYTLNDKWLFISSNTRTTPKMLESNML